MKASEMFKSIRNRNLDLQERLFRLLVIIGLCGLAAGTVSDIIIGEDIKNIILIIATGVFCCVVFYCSLRFHKIQMGAVIIAIAFIFAVLPIVFLSAGGIAGGGPIWFLFGMVYVSFVVVGKVKYVLLVSSFIVNVVCYCIAYTSPWVVTSHTMETAYIDSLVSLLIVSALTCVMIIFQKTTYRSESAIAEEQNREIAELNRAQNRFFSSMSHEIRTPINTIIGLNEMILREDISEEVAADAINIQDASKMLLSLINDFLDMSKIESGKMEIVPVTYEVGRMLSDIVNTVWVRAKEKGLEFHVDVDETVPAQLIGDEIRVKQILLNVLNNAVKYTEAGSVTLSIRSEEDPLVEYAYISYSVTDTGIGIKQENIQYLFDAFKRVDDEEKQYIEGTGLGLAIVKQLVELMDGKIEVNSVYTKGSTFVITLPQKMTGEKKIGEFILENKYNLGAGGHYKQSFEAPKAHVLIVDDDETNLMVAEKLLRETKVQIDTATSGAECLEKTLTDPYDVILMDHLMPGMDGIECLHAIRNQTEGLNSDTHVVILTANAGGENLALYRREGFDGYLPKPVDGTQLEEELLKHLPKEVVTLRREEGSVGVVETPILTYKKKLPVIITAGSVCDLPEDLIERYQIAILPYRIATEDGYFLDGIEAETDGVLSYISDRGKMIKSDAPTRADYEEFFAEQLTKAGYVIHISMARHASAGHKRSLEAAKAFDNVLVVDSGHLSTGLGLMVLRAAEYAEEGMSAHEIVKKIEEMKTQVSTSFVVDSTEYLARSGRLSSKVDRLCKAFMLHPVLVMKKSRITVGTIRIGGRNSVWKRYIASTLHKSGAIDTGRLFITYTGLTKEELEDIREQVEKKVKFKEVIFQKASPTVSTNCGPGTFGLLFMMERGKKE